jgi:hypothetical protein
VGEPLHPRAADIAAGLWVAADSDPLIRRSRLVEAQEETWMKPTVRTGQGPEALSKSEFESRFRRRFIAESCLDRYIGYYGDYATSHNLYDHDEALHAEVGNAARALHVHMQQRRKGIKAADAGLNDPRPK